MYISTKQKILCSFVSRYYDPTFVFNSLRFRFHFCRAVTKSPRPEILPGYFHRKQEENIEPKVLPAGCTVPLLLIAFPRQLEMLATAL